MIMLLYNFAINMIATIWLLGHATQGQDVFVALLFLPISFYFGMKALVKIMRQFPAEQDLRLTVKHAASAKIVSQSAGNRLVGVVPDPEEAQPLPETGTIDFDRRTFLKLITSAGLSLFIMSMFTKRAHAAFFGSLPGATSIQIKNAAGTVIDPSQAHPTDGYEITNIDDASAPAYYGFLHKSGAWYITKEGSDGSYRYTKGSSNFATNWTGRAALTYNYYDIVFA